MNAETAEALRKVLQRDPDADISALVTRTDPVLSIGRDVWRLRWRGQLTTAVTSDADLHTTCGALLDGLALHEVELDRAGDEAPGAALGTVNLLVDRPVPGDAALSETDQALRTLRTAVRGLTARVWYRRSSEGWIEDLAPPPTWESDPRVRSWVDDLLLPRLTARPAGLVMALVDAVDDPSLHLYPSEIRAGATDRWAIRLDGLEIGTGMATAAILTIGKPGQAGDGPQRQMFIEVFGQPEAKVSAAPAPGDLGIEVAAERIRALLRRFREVDVRGAPLAHRSAGGVTFVDEHALEARLLKGLTTLGDGDVALVLDDDHVARGSQLPTLWGVGTRPRYLDALLRRGETPLAVELKVARGGQGRYYRRAIAQAVLYRHFILHATALEPWFKRARLDRSATEASIGIPIPAGWTAMFERNRALLERVGRRVGVVVHILDDRVTPEYTLGADLPEPDGSEREVLSWRLAASLSARWPSSLGRILEVHDGGGQYDQLDLRSTTDRALSVRSPRPRVSLNRAGSAWVFSQAGSVRWTWRHIWNYLAAGGDVADAAAKLAGVAGLGGPQASTDPTFAEMAVAFLDYVPGQQWSWRCAWTDNAVRSAVVDRFRVPLRRYNRASTGEALPTVARLWGAVGSGEALVIADQQNLRTWVWSSGAPQELMHARPVDRIRADARLVGAPS